MENPIDKAVAFFGSAAKLADAIDVSPQAVSFWKDGTRRIGADKCLLIERETQGQVRCEDLRPDCAWDVLRTLPPDQVAAAPAYTGPERRDPNHKPVTYPTVERRLVNEKV